MKNLFIFLLLLAFNFAAFGQREVSPFGEWNLESWSIGLEMDLNKDGKKSDNLITETSCENREKLSVKNDNTIISVMTFNPTVNVSLDGSNYKISEKCNKGSIGFGSAFKMVNSDLNLDQGGSYKIENGQLIRVFEGAINVFNTDFSEVIETKDLVLTYRKN